MPFRTPFLQSITAAEEASDTDPVAVIEYFDGTVTDVAAADPDFPDSTWSAVQVCACNARMIVV